MSNPIQISPQHISAFRTVVNDAATEAMSERPDAMKLRAQLADAMRLLDAATEPSVRMRATEPLSGVAVAGEGVRNVAVGEEVDMPLSMATRMIDVGAVAPVDFAAFKKMSGRSDLSPRAARAAKAAVKRAEIEAEAEKRQAEILAELASVQASTQRKLAASRAED